MSTGDSIGESEGCSRTCAPQLIENCVLRRSHLYGSIAKRPFKLRRGVALCCTGVERQSAAVILAHIIGIFQKVPGKDSDDRFTATNEARACQLANSGDRRRRGGFATDPVAANHCFGICDFLLTYGDNLPLRTKDGTKGFLPRYGRADSNRGCQGLGVFDWCELFRN